MLEDMRRGVLGFVEAGMSAVSGALTPSRARDLARSMAKGEGMEQINRVAQELLEWSQRSREWITETVQREVKKQLGAAGIATREDLDALRKRVRELEKGSSSKPKRSSAKSSASKSPAKRSSAGDAQPAAGLGDPGPPAP